MARSLAFWFDDKPEKKVYDVDLHINFWSFDSEKVNYLDIGVLVKSNHAISNTINIYFPFEITHDDYFSELGSLVCSDRELISAIFNTNVSKTQADAKNDVFKIEFTPTNKLSFHTQILPETDNSEGGVKLIPFNESASTNNEKGTILKFPPELFQSTDTTETDYFRFRIKLSKKSKDILGPEYSPKGSLITNYFNSTEMIDFRINEPRNLPSKVRAKLNDSLKLRAVHFFLIRDANSEFKMSHSKYKRCRILENNIWKKYLKLGVPPTKWWEKKLKQHFYLSISKLKLPEQMLIYHWAEVTEKQEVKQDSGTSDKQTNDTRKIIDHFSAFAKFSQRKTGFFRMFSVVILILSLGITASLAANFLTPHIKNIWTSITKPVELESNFVVKIHPLDKKAINSANINNKDAININD